MVKLESVLGIYFEPLNIIAAWSLQNFLPTMLRGLWRHYACQLLLLYRLVLFLMELLTKTSFVDDFNQFYNVNIQEAVSQGPEILNKKPARELTVHIDRFAYIFRFDQNPFVISFNILNLFICPQHASETFSDM